EHRQQGCAGGARGGRAHTAQGAADAADADAAARRPRLCTRCMVRGDRRKRTGARTGGGAGAGGRWRAPVRARAARPAHPRSAAGRRRSDRDRAGDGRSRRAAGRGRRGDAAVGAGAPAVVSGLHIAAAVGAAFLL
ncbi:MAG: DNA internalization-related competence protein ComEC/Rec2, partial [uncultured Sphingomonas sp.]